MLSEFIGYCTKKTIFELQAKIDDMDFTQQQISAILDDIANGKNGLVFVVLIVIVIFARIKKIMISCW